VRIVLGALIIGCALLLTGAPPADAKGTVLVQQSDGSTQSYAGVDIRITNKTLRITTADGKGTLVIDKAACSYAGDLLRCLPYSITLDQGGGTHPLDFERGTIYANLTDAKQQLPFSSTQVPPKGILLALKTKIGTIVTMTGEIDEVSK
jgi:hypothetical protein